MTNRLKMILLIGSAAIALTYGGTRLMEKSSSAESPSDEAYQKQLADLRKKQEANAKSLKETKDELPSVASRAVTEPIEKDTGSLASESSPQSTANQLPHRLQSTLQSLQMMMSSAKGTNPAVANYTSDAHRLQYLESMPVSMIESTRKQDATTMARQDAGRIDPFGELSGATSFPKKRSLQEHSPIVAGKKGESDILSGPEGLPPPPPSAASSISTVDVAPPPPPPGIELDELPPPPEKPMLSKHLKLNAILGDQVILAFKDRNYQRRNHFKQYITLTQGQEFDSVTLVDVGQDQATLEEHGRQITMRLDPIR